MLKKNQIIPLTIESVTITGNGVGHYDTVAVFVPMTARQDELDVRIVKVMSHYCFGIIERIRKPSPDRIPSDCPAYKKCGGCQLRHMTYEAELREKALWVADAIQRIGGFSLEPLPILPSLKANGYRNKAQYPFGEDENGIFCGFYAPRSHRVIRSGACPLQPALFSEIAESVCEFAMEYKLPLYDEKRGTGLLRHLYLRQAEVTGEVMVTLVLNGRELPHAGAFIQMMTERFPTVASLLINCNTQNTNVILGRENIVLWGKDHITDRLSGVTVDLSPHSFYQVNHDGAEQLYQEAAEMAALAPGNLLLDLYCGAGTIGLSMAEQAGRLIGVEIVESAVLNARKNARRAGRTNAEFIIADAAKAAEKLAAEGLRPNVIVLDPPRKGCDEKTLEAVVRMAPDRLVMVSCNPSTLARDLKFLAGKGYIPQKVRPVDLFPRTAHVETVVLLEHS